MDVDVLALRDVSKDLETAVAPCVLRLDAADEIKCAADRAILVALVVTELALNAAKHAYPDRPGEPIWVRVASADGNAFLISVRDEGVGLPAGHDPSASKRLGTRLITALSKQLGAELTRPASLLALTLPIGGSMPLGS